MKQGKLNWVHTYSLACEHSAYKHFCPNSKRNLSQKVNVLKAHAPI